MENSLGERIRSLRIQKYMTQADLGELAGVNPVMIGYFETESRKPGLGSLMKIADALEVSIDFLLGRAAYTNAYVHLDAADTDNPAVFVTDNKKAPAVQQRKGAHEHADRAVQSSFGLTITKDELIRIIDKRVEELFNGGVASRVGK